MSAGADPRVHRTRVSGIPVVWRQGPEPLSAGLVLGVGRRDEGFVDGGVTHLLEHLVMHEAGTPRLECNGSVGLTTTELTVTGRPDRVVAFLRRACELLADPPVQRLAVEASVLAAEERESGASLGAAHLAERYGNRGAGIAALVEPALQSVTPEQVRRWAARWAVTGNAALWLTGPPPEGLDLPLPEGPRPPARPVQVAVGTFPAWTELPEAPVSLSVQGRDDVAGLVVLRVLRQRVEDELRHQRGLTYGVDLDHVRLADDLRHAGVSVEVADGREPVAVSALRGALHALAVDGPTPEELAGEVADFAETRDDPRGVADDVQALAECLVMGWSWQDDDTYAAALGALTPADVRDAARALEATVLVAVPEDAQVEDPGLERRPVDSPDVVQDGRRFSPRILGGAPPGARLVVGDAGVVLTLRRGDRTSVLWDDVLGLVEEEDGSCHLVGAAGWSVPVQARDWRRGDEALALVRQRVPAELQVRADREDPDRLPDG